MNTQKNQSNDSAPGHRPSNEEIGIHVLHYLTSRQMHNLDISFDKLYRHLPVRRFELQRVLTLLDRQGLIDATRLRLTLAGFAVGHSLRKSDLPQLRATRAAARAA